MRRMQSPNATSAGRTQSAPLRFVAGIVAVAVATVSLSKAVLAGFLASSISDDERYEATRPESVRVEIGPDLVSNLWWTTATSAAVFAAAIAVTWFALRRMPTASRRVASVALGLFVGISAASLTA